jgi:glucosyl-3-phosphoglycerate synthase
MTIDIAKSIFRKLASNGMVFNQETFRSIKATYQRIALDLLDQYNSDAVMNGLYLDRNLEEETVDMFAQNVYNAGMDFLSNPMQTSFIPSWNRVKSAIPDYMDQFYEAVESDNQ